MPTNISSDKSRLRVLAAGACIAVLGGGAAVVLADAGQSTVPPAAAALAVLPTSPPQTEAERKAFSPEDKSPAAIVNAFNQMAFFDHEPVEAMKKYLADSFVEHYPDLAQEGAGTDKELTIRFFQSRGWKKGEGMQDLIYKLIADKDYAVVFHKTFRTAADRGTAYVDIFRVANGLIVEHWAVGQPVSDKISARHNMF